MNSIFVVAILFLCLVIVYGGRRALEQAPGVEDVPCGSCVHGYGSEHVCDVPDYCPCDQTELHEPVRFTPECAHVAAPEPVVVADGPGGKGRIVGWLCPDCLASVSEPLPRLTMPDPTGDLLADLRAALDAKVGHLDVIASRFEHGDGVFIASERDLRAYQEGAEEVHVLRAQIRTVVNAQEDL